MNNHKPHLAIITALPKEFAAVQRLLSHHEEASIDDISYTYGKIAGKNGSHSVVLACQTQYGNNTAAITATKAILRHPSIRDIIVVGIGGGVPRPKEADKHTRLGDIVVSSAAGVVQFDFGAITPQRFKFRGISPKPSPKLLQEVNSLQSKLITDRNSWNSYLSAFLKKAAIKRPKNEPKHSFKHPADRKRDKDIPKILYGRIGASNAVIKDAKKRDSVAGLFDLLAFEMEGSGIADATWSEGVGYLIIRGIVDYSDATKNDAWHDYAAHSAAAYLGLLLNGCNIGRKTSPEEENLTNIIEYNLKEGICNNQTDILQFLYMISEKHKDLKEEFYGPKRPDYLEKYYKELSDYARHKVEEAFNKNFILLHDYFKGRASTKPRICIKVHEDDGEETFIIDLHREANVNYSTRHRLKTNSGFYEVYKTGQFILVNNIPIACKKNKFENPRLDLSKAAKHEPLVKNGVDVNWVKCWKTLAYDGKKIEPDPMSCYKSTMIIPLTLWGKKLDYDFKQRFGINTENIDRVIYGYLCFDHTEIEYFRCMDVAVGYIFADLVSLYLINQMIFTDRSKTFLAVTNYLQGEGRLSV